MPKVFVSKCTFIVKLIKAIYLAIIIIFITKQAYYPEFSIFIIDEVMEVYNKTEFNRIFKYI